MKQVSRIESIKRGEMIFMIGYFVVYLGYLTFINLENEFLHWISLVILPLTIAYFIQVHGRENRSFLSFLDSVGINRSTAGHWIGWAVLIGLGLSTLQLVISRNADAFYELLRSGKVFINAPIAFFFLLFTTGLTEEVFFRGLLQTRLHKLTQSPWAAILLSTLLFGIYHIPYAYLNPNWPSAGNLPHAIQLAMVDGSLGGLILGFVFFKSRYNLLTVILVHTLIDLFPAMTMIKFGGQ